MAKQQAVNWNATHKQWVKTFQGKKYYLGTGRGKSDRESKKAAIQRMEEIKSLVVAGESIKVASQVPTTHKPKKKARKKSTKTRRWTPLLVKSVVNQLIREKMGIAEASNGEDLSFGRVLNLKNRLKHFTEYFGDRKLSTITAADLTKWSQVAAKRVSSGEIAPATLHKDYTSVKQLLGDTSSLPRQKCNSYGTHAPRMPSIRGGRIEEAQIWNCFNFALHLV